jgi:1-deoxy-D-xylulose-5-phosphate synthase
MPALRKVGRAEVLAEPGTAAVDVLIVSIGAVADLALEAAAALSAAGCRVRVVDPCWVTPVDEALVGLTRQAGLVVSVEDGVAVGGAGSRLAAAVADAGVGVPVRTIGLPTEFLGHGTPAEVRAAAGLTAPDIARRVTGWASNLSARADAGSAARAREAVSE